LYAAYQTNIYVEIVIKLLTISLI